MANKFYIVGIKPDGTKLFYGEDSDWHEDIKDTKVFNDQLEARTIWFDITKKGNPKYIKDTLGFENVFVPVYTESKDSVEETKSLKENKDSKAFYDECKDVFNQLKEILESDNENIEEIKNNINKAYKLVNGNCRIRVSSTGRTITIDGSVKGSFAVDRKTGNTYTLYNSISLEYFFGDVNRLAEDLTMAYYKTNGGTRFNYTPKFIKYITENEYNNDSELTESFVSTKDDIVEEINSVLSNPRANVNDLRKSLKNAYFYLVNENKSESVVKESVFKSDRDIDLFLAAERAFRDGYHYYDLEDDENKEECQYVIEEYLEPKGLTEEDFSNFLDVLCDIEDRSVYRH